MLLIKLSTMALSVDVKCNVHYTVASPFTRGRQLDARPSHQKREVSVVSNDILDKPTA
jgi:hypothetical protein